MGRKCIDCNDKRASYNTPGQCAKYCKGCKKDDMVDVVNKRCIECKMKQPKFGYPGEKATHCGDCKEAEMVDVVSKRCVVCKTKQPNFGMPGGKRTHCGDCRKAEMVDVLNKRCVVCKIKRPNFGIPGEEATHCKGCKEEAMVDVRSKRCVVCKIKQPTFGMPGGKSTHCGDCKEAEMVDVGHMLCNSGIDCDSQAHPTKYDGMCARCFRNLKKDDPRLLRIRTKEKEEKVRLFINGHYEGFTHDKVLEYDGCDCLSRRRIDHRKLIGNTLLCIETDENQHKSYSKIDEETRYNDLVAQFTCKFIFIRFNPDSFIDSKGRRRNTPLPQRLEILKKTLDFHIERINAEQNTELFEVYTLFFDNYV